MFHFLFFLVEGDEVPLEETDNFSDDDANLREVNRKFKPFRDRQDKEDRRSTYTTSTMASIAPEVIKERVKVNNNDDFLAFINRFLNLFLKQCTCDDETLQTYLISSCLKLEHYFCNIQK